MLSLCGKILHHNLIIETLLTFSVILIPKPFSYLGLQVNMLPSYQRIPLDYLDPLFYYPNNFLDVKTS